MFDCIPGFLYDKLGDYKVAFHVAGAPPILGALLMFFIPKVTQVSCIEFMQCSSFRGVREIV